MRRGAKPKKTRAAAKRTGTGKSRQDEASRVRDLEKRLAEALEQQRAMSEIIRAISGSPTDTSLVFAAILESATRLCDAGLGILYRYEGGGLFRMVATHGTRPEYQAFLLRQAYRVGPPFFREDGPWRAGQVPDVRETEPYRRGDLLWTTSADLEGLRTCLNVPLIRERALLGAITVYRREVRAFSEAQIEVLRTFADQALIAIGNVQLFTELQEKNRALTEAHAQVTEALEQQTATSEVLRVMASSPTVLQPVLETVITNAVRLAGANQGHIRQYDGEFLRVVAHYGESQAELEKLTAVPLRPDGASASGRAFLERRVIHIEDAHRDRSYRGPALALGGRTVLVVPLLREGIPIGTISIWRYRMEPFGEKQIEVVSTFASEAVIAIENVRLFKALEEKNRSLIQAHARVTEALERQTATADILRIISRSQTDLEPVFATIADSALGLLRAWSVLIVRYDGQLLHLGAVRGGLPDSDRYQRERFPMPLASGLLIAECILTRAPQQEPDCLAHPDPGARERARRRGHRALLGVPMLRGGEAVGAILVTRAEAGVFAESDVALLQTFADQAVIAIENARLLSELQARTHDLTHRVEQLTALGEVGRALSSTLDLDAVLQTIVTRASQLAGTDSCSVFEYDETIEAFHLRATHNLDEAVVALARRTPIHRGEGVQGRMAITRQPVQVVDIAEEDAYSGPLRDVLLRTGTRAVLAIPMLREEQLIGGLTVSKKASGEFSPEVIDLLKTFATQSALAIQNARLFREIADKSRQLEAASRHKSEFLANMSHELRTPLNAIIGFSEVLTERMFGELNDKQDEYLKDIHASGQHLVSLINDILDLSKIEAGRMELELKDFDLPQAIGNAVTLVRERAGRRGIVLHQAVDPSLGQILGDERKIKQVLLNLISNALKFTPEGGRVEVRATVANGMAEVSVTDTGVGIAPEDQEAVFEEFRQVGTADKKMEGTGLGLALSRKFIELHGGRIWVESRVGRGSTFTFTLPLRRDD